MSTPTPRKKAAKKAPAKSAEKSAEKVKSVRSRLNIEENMKIKVVAAKELPEDKKPYRGQRKEQFELASGCKDVNAYYQAGGDRGWLRFFIQDGTLTVA